MSKQKILLVDDEASIRSALREILEFEGYEIEEAVSGDQALELLDKVRPNLIMLDIKMKGKDGLETLDEIRSHGNEVPVIMLSGHGNLETAVQATKLGAYDFLQKPPDLNRLLISVRNALDKSNLEKENIKMRRRISNVREIIGESKPIQKIKETIKRVAPTEARVLITGENGTGKELVARWIHEYSKRQRGPFVEVNCAAIPSELLESELFGHEKGSFTGASNKRIGKFEQANGGTLFLDEIGDMSADAQAKVLRALQENIVTRVGGNEPIQVDVRVLAATNKDLDEEIQTGNFREDLFHRINVIPIRVPSLKERSIDIPVLAEAFLHEFAQTDIQFADKTFNPDALDYLSQQSWSGNVRELRNVVERLVILSADNQITKEDCELFVIRRKSEGGDVDGIIDQYEYFSDFKDEIEKRFIERKLDQYDWNISQTAESIGIQRSHLYNKMKKFQIQR